MTNSQSDIELMDYCKGADDDLDCILARCKPDVDAYMEQIRQMPLDDDQPMQKRHRELGRQLQAAGLKFFREKGRTPQSA